MPPTLGRARLLPLPEGRRPDALMRRYCTGVDASYVRFLPTIITVSNRDRSQLQSDANFPIPGHGVIL